MTTIWPSSMSSPRWTKLRSGREGRPTLGSTTPVELPGSTRAVTELFGSVIRVTWEVPRVVGVTLPASPSAATTGSSTRTPALVPWSIVTVEYQTVGERPITRPVTVSSPGGHDAAAGDRDQLRQLLALLERRLGLGEPVAKISDLVRNSSFSPFASKVS